MTSDEVLACRARRCRIEPRLACTVGQRLEHWHPSKPYIIANNAGRITPKVIVLPIDRERGVWASYSNRGVVRFEVIRRAS